MFLSVFGYELTPWFILFCLSIVGILVSVIVIVVTLANRNKREQKIISKALADISKIPVSKIDTVSISDAFTEKNENNGEDNISVRSSETGHNVIIEKVSSNKKFCHQCGAALMGGDFCPQCGARII